MRLQNVKWILGGACVAIALAGCAANNGADTSTSAGAGSALPLVQRHGWIPAVAPKEKLLYVSDYTSSIVLIYKQGATSQGPVGEITTGISSPEGVAVDKSGTLYVANQGNNTITEYAAGSQSPKVTLSTDINKPLDVSVDSTGILYVTEGSASTILEFKPGSTSPDQTVSLSHPSSATNVKNDDLYVSYNESSVGHVGVCKPLASTCTDLGLSGIEFAQGLAVDLHGRILVGDVYKFVIDIFKPGQTTEYRQISIPYEEAGKLAFDTKDKTLYMADPANFAVRLLNYKTGLQESDFTYSSDELEGVALYPGQKPGK